MTSHRLPAIIVTDSTLGDAPAALSKRNQIDIALALEQAGIDEIELSAQGPIEHIGAALFASQTVIAGPATKGTVDAALRAGFDAVNLSLSLRTGRTPLLATIKRVVGYATKRGLAVALSGEDASRTDIDLVFAVIAAAESAGARRFRYADTTGVLHPVRTHCVFRQLCAETDLELEFRGHDHFGLAIANTLAAIQGGATHISVSENTSETGPARLGSVVDAIQLATPHHTRVDTARLPALSALVAASTPWRPSTNRVSSKDVPGLRGTTSESRHATR